MLLRWMFCGPDYVRNRIELGVVRETMPKNPRQDKKTMPKKRVGRDWRHAEDRTRVAPRSVAGIMKSGGWLQHLRAHEDERKEWRQWLRAALPEELGTAVVDASLKGGVLVVQAISAGWAARLRFALPALADPIRDRSPGIVTVKVRVVRGRALTARTRAPSPGS